MELEEVLKKYKKPKKPMPLKNILRVFIREGIENFYICRKEDVDVLIEGIDRLQKENDLAKKALIANSYEADERNNLLVKIQELQKENEELKEYNMTYKKILGFADNRIYRKKYLEERRKEQPNLLYPDSDEIYQRYYELKEENEHLHREINLRIKLKIENEKIVDTQLKVLQELLDESEE